MKTLPEKLRRNGYDYTLVQRGQRAFIYAQMVSKRKVQYEVFQLRTKPDREIEGKFLEATECFPHDEAFGVWAWTITDHTKALKKFNQLEGIL